jgi:bifunctional enzyme CysN/CysC/sulfate adenylyltransferase subunit 1
VLGVEEFLPRLDMKDVKFIPVSALDGDNVVHPSTRTPWYPGPTLLGHLESVHIGSDWNLNDFRLPVQWVNRPNNPQDPGLHDFRGFSGQIAGGIVRVGQPVMVLPSGFTSMVKEIWTLDGVLQEAFSPQSVTLVLEHDIDVSRGDVFVDPNDLPAQVPSSMPKFVGCTHGLFSAERNTFSNIPRRPFKLW